MEKKKKESSWSLRKERKVLVERLKAMDAVTDEYKTILHRIINIDDTLLKRRESRINIAKTGGMLGLGAVSLFLAYKNDTTENPVFRKGTQGIAQKFCSVFKL